MMIHPRNARRRAVPAALACLAGGVALAAAGRPNVLFIVADDLRAELGCYGSEQAITPNIDRLAAQGVVFERAYCQQAVCNPSRASVLTGLRPDTLRVWDLHARFRETVPAAVPLPEWFKRHGYHTEGIGKIFHNQTRPDPGRPLFADPPSWSVPPTHASGAHWEDWHVPGDPSGPRKKGEAWQCLDAPDEAYFDGQIAADACAALERLAGQDQPFFLAVGFWKPHLPFNAPKRYWDLYRAAQFDTAQPAAFPAGAPEIARHNWHELRGYRGIPAEGPLGDDLARTLRHGYFACISFLDTQVGRVLDQLERSGLAGDTVVVFWGDQGFHTGEHDLWGKTTNYELDTRAPLILSAPGVASAGSRSSALVELLDLYPTLTALAGLPAPDGLEGASLLPLLADPALPGRPYALSQHPQPFYSQDWTAMGYALRTGRFRYVEWRDRESGEVLARELYDHATDPGETRNLVADPGYTGDLAELEALARGAIGRSPIK